MMRRVLFASTFVLMTTVASAQDGAAVYSQRCASCHDNAATSRAPARDALTALSAARIVETLDTGVMRIQGEPMSPQERLAVATYLSRDGASGGSDVPGPRACTTTPALPLDADTNWNGWGVNAANQRYQRKPGLTAAQVSSLKVKWAFGFPGETSAATQPIIVGNRVFVGSNSGNVYALGLEDGCVQWTFKAEGAIRAALTIVPHPGGGTSAIVGDLRGNVYSLDAMTGSLRWKRRIDDHRAARVTGAPAHHAGRLFAPVSSLEELSGAQPGYECCTFRGSLVALDAGTGEIVWKTYTIPEAPKQMVKSTAGTQIWGPSGAAIWAVPTIDPQTNSIYVATGDSYTHPAPATTDAVMAFDMSTGAVKWTNQLLAGDAWNLACGSPNPANCPENAGPDHDFGQSPILVSLPNGKRLLAVAQKSATVYGLDPDDRGRTLWTVKIGKGGMLGGAEWGSASDGFNIYVPLSDLAFKLEGGARGLDSTAGGGLFAIRLIDGRQMWSIKPATCTAPCSPAQSAPAAVIPGVVFSGSLDGHFRAYSTEDGRVIWDFDTARDFETVNGVKANGGSIDVGGPAIANGYVLTTSGYPTWGGKRGNVLIAFGAQ